MLKPTDNETTQRVGAGQTRGSANQLERRPLLRALSAMGVAGLAGCLGDDNDNAGEGVVEADTPDEDGADDGDGGADDEKDDSDGADDDNPYYRQELENAIANLDAPDPGTGVVVFENDGEYRTEDVACEEDIEAPDDPEKGTAEGVFEFDDGETFSIELSRVDDMGDIRNTITLIAANPDDEGPDEVAVPRSLWPIKPEPGADGSSAFVIREEGTWYGGIEIDPSNVEGFDYGKTWVAITCE